MADDDQMVLPQKEVNKLRSNVNTASKYLLYVILLITVSLMAFAFVWTRVMDNEFPIRVGETTQEATATSEPE